jgi:hypothetical protein
LSSSSSSNDSSGFDVFNNTSSTAFAPPAPLAGGGSAVVPAGDGGILTMPGAVLALILINVAISVIVSTMTSPTIAPVFDERTCPGQTQTYVAIDPSVLPAFLMIHVAFPQNTSSDKGTACADLRQV